MSAMTQWTVDTSVVDPMAGIVSLTTCRMKFFHASWQHSLFVLRKTKFKKKTEIKIKLNFSFSEYSGPLPCQSVIANGK